MFLPLLDGCLKNCDENLMTRDGNMVVATGDAAHNSSWCDYSQKWRVPANRLINQSRALLTNGLNEQVKLTGVSPSKCDAREYVVPVRILMRKSGVFMNVNYAGDIIFATVEIKKMKNWKFEQKKTLRSIIQGIIECSLITDDNGRTGDYLNIHPTSLASVLVTVAW